MHRPWSELRLKSVLNSVGERLLSPKIITPSAISIARWAAESGRERTPPTTPVGGVNGERSCVSRRELHAQPAVL